MAENNEEKLGWEQQAQLPLEERLEDLPHFETAFGNSYGHPVDQAESVWWGV